MSLLPLYRVSFLNVPVTILQEGTSFRNEEPGKLAAGHREAHSWLNSTGIKSSSMQVEREELYIL